MASSLMLNSSSSSGLLRSHLRVCWSPSNAQLIRRTVLMTTTRCSAEKPSSADGPNPNPSTSGELASRLESSKSAEKQKQPVKTRSVGATSVAPISKAASVSFQSIMAFNGVGPRPSMDAAMLGFVWALAGEFATHETVVEQLSSGRFPVLAVMLLFSSASLIPLLSGSRNFGPFNAQAELLNGRIAMIGFSGLILAESIQDLPLIH